MVDPPAVCSSKATDPPADKDQVCENVAPPTPTQDQSSVANSSDFSDIVSATKADDFSDVVFADALILDLTDRDCATT